MKKSNGMDDGAREDVGLGDGDDVRARALAAELEQAIHGMGMWVKRTQVAMDAAWCQWEGQSPKGVKVAGKDGKVPFPWDGASDARVRDVWRGVRDACAVANAAFKRGRWRVAGQETTDARWGAKMSTLLRWMVRVQMRPSAERERKLALFYKMLFGLGVLLVDWEREVGYELVEVDFMGLAELFGLTPYFELAGQSGLGLEGFVERVMVFGGSPEEVEAAAEIRNALDLAQNPEREGELGEVLMKVFPSVKRGAAKRAARELREVGKTKLPSAKTLVDRPRWKALLPGDEVFFPAWTPSLEEARWVGVREWYTRGDVVAKRESGEWDRAFCEKLLGMEGMSSTMELERVRQRMATWAGGSGGWEAATEDRSGLFEVFVVYRWLTDEYGVKGLYKTVMNPKATDADGEPFVGAHELCDYAHQRMPFVELVYFRDAVNLWELAGLGYLLYTHQNERKNMRDYRIDVASVSILPPMKRHPRDMELPVRLGPDAVIWESVRGTSEWMKPPASQYQLGVELERAIARDIDREAGSFNAELPAPGVQLTQQELADEYLEECTEVLTLTFQLMQQYLPEGTALRVTGPLEKPFEVKGEEIRGQFDVRLTFDVRELDTEFAEKKAAQLIEIAKTDTSGRIDRGQLTELLLGLLDAHAGDVLLASPEQAQEQEVEDELAQVARMALGIESRYLEAGSGANHRLRRQVLERELQQNPVIMRQVQSDERVRELFMKRLENLQFMEEQVLNRERGKTGVKAVNDPYEG